MSNVKKLMMTAAGGDALNVEDVFSTYVYEGNGSTKTITNGIDLSTEGGMVWIKNRQTTYSHQLFDAERGATKYLISNLTNGEYTATNSLTSFNTDGFSLSDQASVNTAVSSVNDFASWTFRKAPKFFDVVTYTGTGANQTISHNLGSTPGMIIVKNYSGTGGWIVYHRSNGATKFMYLNGTTTVQTSSLAWNDTAPTSTEFTVGTLGGVNNTGNNHVAYLFAHHDGDGEFGPDGDADIIKCGSYTNDSNGKATVDLGFEPQWLLVKRTDGIGAWFIFDAMRGLITGDADRRLIANLNAAESGYDHHEVTSTGFKDVGPNANASFVYIAIRRGPMAVPEDATDVFDIQSWTGDNSGLRTISTNITHDAALLTDKSTGFLGFNKGMYTRLTGNEVHVTSSNQPDSNWSGTYPGMTQLKHDVQEGIELPDDNDQWNSSSDLFVGYFWKRAPNYFDVVTYTGSGASGQTINHNLGVAPEMIWVKNRTETGNWYVYHANVSADPETDYLALNQDNSALSNLYFWNSTLPTSTQFFVNSATNTDTQVAFLFASLDGISKVGSYTGNGSSQTIDCGFSNGARFVLIKRTDISRNWYLWDSERGIVSGNDPHTSLNTTSAEDTTDDVIDPASSGFIVNQVGTLPGINVSGGSYVFYAIA